MTFILQPYINPIFIEIGAVKRTRGAIQYALESEYPAYIISDPGYGKSTALHYLSQAENGAFLQISDQTKSVSGLYRGLLKALDCYSWGPYERDQYERLVSTLKSRSFDGSRPLIIIDEFQALEDRAKRELLKIQEDCRLALVLGGNAERITSSNSGKKDALALKQIESRIGMRVFLPALTRPECVDIGAAYGLEGMDAYEAVENLGTQTNVRTLCMVFQQARKMAGPTAALRLNHIRTALLALNGKTTALKLLEHAED
ncbi:AAA family ATPase [Rhizobium puerariae]|uniref:AAA family ATPase n=1 Tax=Rhizobium puerariae TaxID=1585791 RepID=A0ABV6AQI3_9HYPH